MDFYSIDNGRTGKGLLFVVSSVSGGGKTTVIKGILELVEELELSVSHTTRKPRPGEVDGADYTFIDEAEFKGMIDEGLFLEWAIVYGHYYGTSRTTTEAITSRGWDAILDIDVQGAMQVKGKRQDAVLIFIVAPSEEEQERRLKDRGTENSGEVTARLEAARQELAFIDEYRYSVLNDDVNDAIQTVISIIRSERCRNRRNPTP